MSPSLCGSCEDNKPLTAAVLPLHEAASPSKLRSFSSHLPALGRTHSFSEQLLVLVTMICYWLSPKNPGTVIRLLQAHANGFYVFSCPDHSVLHFGYMHLHIWVHKEKPKGLCLMGKTQKWMWISGLSFSNCMCLWLRRKKTIQFISFMSLAALWREGKKHKIMKMFPFPCSCYKTHTE